MDLVFQTSQELNHDSREQLVKLLPSIMSIEKNVYKSTFFKYYDIIYSSADDDLFSLGVDVCKKINLRGFYIKDKESITTVYGTYDFILSFFRIQVLKLDEANSELVINTVNEKPKVSNIDVRGAELNVLIRMFEHDKFLKLREDNEWFTLEPDMSSLNDVVFIMYNALYYYCNYYIDNMDINHHRFIARNFKAQLDLTSKINYVVFLTECLARLKISKDIIGINPEEFKQEIVSELNYHLLMNSDEDEIKQKYYGLLLEKLLCDKNRHKRRALLSRVIALNISIEDWDKIYSEITKKVLDSISDANIRCNEKNKQTLFTRLENYIIRKDDLNIHALWGAVND